MDWFTRRHARGRPPHPDVLTPAEWRVLDGVREGLQNTEIADRLGVSVNTVRSHVSSMLAKLDLPDRYALAAWDGIPAPASTRALDRFGLLAPLFGQWMRLAASGTAIALAASILWVALDGGRGGTSGAGADATPVPTASATEVEEPTPTVSPTPRPTAAAPYRVEFAAGEPIDVAPAVLLIDPDSGHTTAWVFDASWGEFGVSPEGDYIIWPDGEEFHLLRTDTGDDRVVGGLSGLPISYSANGDGFLGHTHGGGILSWFDAQGNGRGDLQIGVDVGRGSQAWGRQAVARAGYCDRPTCNSQNVLSLWTRPVLSDGSIGQARSGPDFITTVPEFSPVSLRYSHEGDRLVLVTSDAVRVFDLTGAMIWEVQGRFHGNPRWSPDDRHLYVSEMGGGETAYLFSAEGAEVLRFETGYAGGCAGEVWLDDSAFAFGEFRVAVDGSIEELPRHHDLYIDLEALGVTLAPSTDGFHQLHYGDEYRPFLNDGTIVVSTPGIGHGGCAT